MQVAFVSLLLAAVARQALAAIYITNPTSSTTAQGGQSLSIDWKDDGTTPGLATIGPCEVGLYAGNKLQQTELQQIATSVDVSTQATLNFTINAALGPNFNEYFIRFTSLNLKDPNNALYPYEAFSAQFSLSGMSGQFSPTVQAQISGAATAGTVGATPTAGTSPSPSISQSKASTTAVLAPASVASSSATPKSTQSSAASTMRGNVGVLSAIGVVVGLAGLTL